MAKSKRELLAPLKVGTVNGQDVTLSDRIQRDIELIPVGPAREAFKAAKIELAIKQAEGRAKYFQFRDNMNFVVTKQGYLAVNGTGTKRGAIFSKKQALEFVTRMPEFKKLAQSLPDQPVRSSDED